MTVRHALTAWLLCAALACTGSRERRVLGTSATDTAAPTAEMSANQAPDTTAGAPSAPPATETVARALLFDAFRAAGYRIRFDVAVRAPGFSFTVDGYDPASRVGYEYIAADERDTDLSSAEQTALAAAGEYRILILEAAAPEALAEPIRLFLASLPARP